MAAARGGSLSVESPQYVALASPRIPCYDNVPCLAFRGGDRVFLYRSGSLYELRHRETRIATSRFVHEGAERQEAIQSIRPGEQFVTLGGDLMTIAVPLEPRARHP